MRDKRSVLGLVAALAVALAALFFAAPAQAAAPVNPTAGSRVLVTPPAPHGASAKTVLASSPGISPSVSTSHLPPNTPYTCSSGNLCAVVWDPTTSDFKIFYLFNCAKYSLSYWSGNGNYYDAQTGGVTSYFYGQSGNVLKSFTPDFTNHTQDWSPVWSIRNC
ncbi:hypothetical protein [Streptomyces sp. SudanB182_2057]|uniref:hypothetical protein n=1 Tax=Streptomyces sp. SudanB182_2057 TaxID=3035281 RepID=UPI003F5570FF